MLDAIRWYSFKINIVFSWFFQLGFVLLTLGAWRPEIVSKARAKLQLEAERQGFHLTAGGFDGYA